VDERHVEVALERLDHLRSLVLAQQAVIDEDARELVADRLVDEQRRDGGVDAARERAEHPAAADLRSDPLDLLLDHGRRRPRRARAGDAVEEVFQHFLAVRRVHDLGVELDAVELPFGRLEGGDRRRVGAAGHGRPLGRRGNGVAVAHPRRLLLGEARGERPLEAHARLAELPGAGLDAAAEVLRHQLHPVADAEHRHPELVQAGVDVRGVLRIDRGRSAGEDHRGRVLRPQRVGGRPVADELRIDTRLADAAGDQLRVLAAEVDDEHGPGIRDRQGFRSRERQQLSADSWAPPS
jgi:hypothetical protein